MGSADLAQSERGTLCDLLAEVGPDAPTLCEGWTTADLAAHLVARERRPDSGPGLVWSPLARHTERVRLGIRGSTPWPELVSRIRRGPPVLLRPFDGPMNTVELFIHVEDVRRTGTVWEPRPLSSEMADALWARVGSGGMAKAVGATIELRSSGRQSKVGGSGPTVVVDGDPGEHVMFGAGRQQAALVSVDGDPELVVRLRSATLGI